MESIRKPQILIQTDGITNTKILIDGKELAIKRCLRSSHNQPSFHMYSGASAPCIYERSVLLKTQEKAFDKVVKIL